MHQLFFLTIHSNPDLTPEITRYDQEVRLSLKMLQMPNFTESKFRYIFFSILNILRIGCQILRT